MRWTPASVRQPLHTNLPVPAPHHGGVSVLFVSAVILIVVICVWISASGVLTHYSTRVIVRFLDEAEEDASMPPPLEAGWAEPIRSALDAYNRTIIAKALWQDANRRAYAESQAARSAAAPPEPTKPDVHADCTGERPLGEVRTDAHRISSVEDAAS